MRWLPEADAAIKKAPFFVRKKARQRVEERVAAEGRDGVTAADVHAAKKRFLNRMDEEVKGYQVDACFGPEGCPNRAVENDGLAESIESVLAAEDLRGFLKQTVGGPLKFHHEFRVTLADCPNACSQPQIKDIGIIGAAEPGKTDEPCSECGACQDICREAAVTLDPDLGGPVFDRERCVYCGQCIKACPTGTITCERRGYRILIGGKLGRHPRLARELPGVYDADTVIHLVKWCVKYYKHHSSGGTRFAALVENAGPDFFDDLQAAAYAYKKRSN
ncbi:MAG: 4Fe-4S binding protein [Desulfobacterales bacterium]|nr:4Fe-4S binding protein [Desulfobacterales bacterium]